MSRVNAPSGTAPQHEPGRRWSAPLLQAAGAVPLLVQLIVAPVLLALSYRYYYLNEDGEVGLQGDGLTLWVVASAVIWILAAALLVILWRRRDRLAAWLVPPAWFLLSQLLHEYLVSSNF